MTPSNRIFILLLGVFITSIHSFPLSHDPEPNSVDIQERNVTQPNVSFDPVNPPTPPMCLGEELHLLPPTQADCRSARQKMESFPYYRDRLNYGKHHSVDIELPLKFSNRSCIIVLDSPPGVADYFSLRDVADAVRLIRIACIKDQPRGMGYGGISGVGHGFGFFMVVQGLPRDPPENPVNATMAVNLMSALAPPRTVTAVNGDAVLIGPSGNDTTVGDLPRPDRQPAEVTASGLSCAGSHERGPANGACLS
ncbi:MAG: hypothetical protein Q9163_001018 [Psora crenata]